MPSLIAFKFNGAVEFTPGELETILGPENFADPVWLERRSIVAAINIDLAEAFDDIALSGRVGSAHADAAARHWLKKSVDEAGVSLMDRLKKGDLESLKTVAARAVSIKVKRFTKELV